MKLLILGHKRSGKDTMAEILRDNFEFTFQSSSQAASDIFIYDVLKDKYGYSTPEECFEDRVNHRSEWYDLICEYNLYDKMRLAKKILETNDGYVGMRAFEECEEAKNLFDLIVWVDASYRVEPEHTSSMTANKWQAHLIIENNGSLEEFKEKVLVFGDSVFKRK